MESEEIKKGMLMSYNEYASSLQRKYGRVPGDYFCTPSCKSKNNKKNSRTSEGLLIHHIMENKVAKLSDSDIAVQCPFDYQKAENLVYCNYLEHLLLHIKIVEEHKDNSNDSLIGIRGIVTYICPELNEYYCGLRDFESWRLNCLDMVKENYEDYIELLKYFIQILIKNPTYKEFSTEEFRMDLSLDRDEYILEKIYRDLSATE